MALELVSPPVKFSQYAKNPAISANGERVVFYSQAALGDTPGEIDGIRGDAYVSTRTAGGWLAASTTPRDPSLNRGWGGFAVARSFTPDFSGWLQIASTPLQFQAGIGQMFRNGLSGFAPLSPLLAPLGNTKFQNNVSFADAEGVAGDHSRVYFRMGEASNFYLPGDPVPAGPGSDANVYVAQLDSTQQPSLALMARDGLGKVWGGSCGSRVGGVSGGEIGRRNQGAVSTDGSLVYFSTRPGQELGACDPAANKLRIMQRLEAPTGPEITPLVASECDRPAVPDPPGPCDGGDGDDIFQGASVDGSRVYFLTPRQLADSDVDTGTACSGTLGSSIGCDLYLYEAAKPVGSRLTQVSAGEAGVGHEIGKNADVLNGVTAISGDGSRVYFVAQGSLTSAANPSGATAVLGQPNLYTWDAGIGAIEFVGTLAAADGEGLWRAIASTGAAGAFQNRAYPVPALGGSEVGGDGHVLLFQTRAQLTTADADGARLDVYRYDADLDELLCVTCRPGGPDSQPFDVFGREAALPELSGTAYAEIGRWASEDGETVVFKTAEGMIPSDTNGFADSYLWRAGELARLPGTTDPDAGSPDIAVNPLNDVPVVSHDGKEVAFQSAVRLLPEDGDTAVDIYVARAGGGFLAPPLSPVCVGEACLGPPTGPPGGPRPTTEGFVGRGNVAGKSPTVRCPKGKHKVVRNGKARCVKNNKGKSGRNRQGGQK